MLCNFFIAPVALFRLDNVGTMVKLFLLVRIVLSLGFSTQSKETILITLVDKHTLAQAYVGVNLTFD